jgi:hypothetical protein
VYYWPFLSVEFLGGENHFNPLSETRHIREDAITVDSVAVEQEDTASRFLREENFGLWRGMVSPTKQFGTDAGLGDSFSHAAIEAGVAIMVSNSIGVKRPSAA